MQALLIECVVRSMLIAAVVALVLFAMRIKTASVLHAVWAGVVVLMMLLPAWVAWGPKASFPVLAPQAAVGIVPPPLPAGLEERASIISASPVRQDEGYVLPDAVTVIYFLGFGVLLLRLAIGTIRARRLKVSVVPVTVGLLRPRVILPESSREWPQAQLDAVLTHEREHVRRRDPLFQWIALLNRAIFWFHPLAWWLERKLSGLAEEACDAAVLSRGYDPREYSEYLLDLARSVQRAGTRIEAVGMAMPGIGLKHRIRKMLSGVPVPRISRARMACTVAVCAAAAAILAAGTLIHAQSAQPGPKFEVASIKVASPSELDSIKQSGGAPRGSISGNTFTSSALPLISIIRLAYNVKVYQVSGAPAWLTQDLYDIAAKGEGDRALTTDQVRQMLQALLAERVHLRLHHETSELPVYSLVVGKQGPKLKESSADQFSMTVRTATGQTLITVLRGTMAQFSATLSSQVARPALDRTGLTGVYDFKLEFAPESQALDPKAPPAEPTGFPSIFTAVQEQLGLKLESTKGLVDVLVIDHVEKPSEN